MPMQADGKTVLQITVGCEPGSDECGECRWYDSERDYCAMPCFATEGTPYRPGKRMRSLDCLEAEAAAKRTIGPRLAEFIRELLRFGDTHAGQTHREAAFSEMARTLHDALAADAATPDPHGPAVRALVQRIATLDVTHLADCNLQEELLAALAEDATLKGW